MWLEVAIITGLFGVGNILFGHFEEQTPKWRRVAKLALFVGLTIFLTEVVGRVWFYVMLAAMAAGVAIIHGWWLPRHGINGWTGEPKEKYYELRGWKLPKQSGAEETARFPAPRFAPFRFDSAAARGIRWRQSVTGERSAQHAQNEEQRRRDKECNDEASG